MNYDSYKYLWPPRPDVAQMPMLLPSLEATGYHAQIKKNGTCNVIAVSPEKKIIVKGRHGADNDHKLWQPDIHKLSAFTGLPGKGWYVFVAELMHSKVKPEDGGVRDTNYIHDVLVLDGDYLVGEKQIDRHSMLCELFKAERHQQTYSHWVIDQYTWVARQFTEGFVELFDSLNAAQDEGLVLKRPEERLKFCGKQTANNAGMVKVRKAHKNYSF